MLCECTLQPCHKYLREKPLERDSLGTQEVFGRERKGKTCRNVLRWNQTTWTAKVCENMLLRNVLDMNLSVVRACDGHQVKWKFTVFSLDSEWWTETALTQSRSDSCDPNKEHLLTTYLHLLELFIQIYSFFKELIPIYGCMLILSNHLFHL